MDEHDFSVRVGQARRFLKAGDTVDLVVIFRGREIQRTPEAKKLLYRIVEALRPDSVPFVIESRASFHGRNMQMTLKPIQEGDL